MNLQRIIRWVQRLPLIPEECHVKGCHERDIEPVTIKAFDPIDHDDHDAKLCADHREWARQRNEFADEMYEPLRETRREVGMDNIDRIQQWVVPQGNIRKDILDGSIKHDPQAKEQLTLEDALE